MRITCILTAYKRLAYFEEQLAAVRNQTHAPTNIIVWRNNTGSRFEPHGVPYIRAVPNMGVWPRFYLPAMLQDADAYCILDDDTIPGRRWLETCVRRYQIMRGVFCAAGFRFTSTDNVRQREVFGWPNPVPSLQLVDWPGHSWFFDQEVALEYARLPRFPEATAGEDMHLAWAAQRRGQICWVPAHREDRTEWGSIHGERGNDRAATHKLPGQKERFQAAFDYYRGRGWKIYADSPFSGCPADSAQAAAMSADAD